MHRAPCCEDWNHNKKNYSQIVELTILSILARDYLEAISVSFIAALVWCEEDQG